MDLSLGFLFCSTDLYFCLCANTILFWWLWLYSIVWSQAGWFLQFHTSFSRLLWLFEVFCISIQITQLFFNIYFYLFVCTGSSLWHVGPNSLARDWNQAPGIRNAASSPLNHQGRPSTQLFLNILSQNPQSHIFNTEASFLVLRLSTLLTLDLVQYKVIKNTDSEARLPGFKSWLLTFTSCVILDKSFHFPGPWFFHL